MRLEKRKTIRVEEEKGEKDEMDVLKAVECLHANINRLDEQYSCHSKLKSKLEKVIISISSNNNFELFFSFLIFG